MAADASPRDPQYLRALVDMGSNGIRFSISTLQPPTARILPTLYQQRVAISLYDAQYSTTSERIPIDEKIISHIVSSFARFHRTCRDFAVPENNITVLATEATRTAINSEDLRKRIKDQIGWEVILLSKQDEGRFGAMGIASSLPEVRGLVIDLGGGSTQLSWLIKERDGGNVRMPGSGAVSMPYGAAAMSRRLAEAKTCGTMANLKTEVQAAIERSYIDIEVPHELQDDANMQGGFTLYLSGGGFRGWGYVLMSKSPIQPYPIPAINGFRANRDEFLGTSDIERAAATALDKLDSTEDIFRVSDRRASQVPAVAFLVNALAETLPRVKEVRFCQGGVREGFLFSALASEVRAQHPLVVASQPFRSATSSKALTDLLLATLPLNSPNGALLDEYKSVFTTEILIAFANLMYYHSSHSKDLQAVCALRISTSGILAGAHGLLHESRALIALLLCARWGDDVPAADKTFKQNLEKIVGSPWILWWIKYLGAIGSFIAGLYPSGICAGAQQRAHVKARWEVDENQCNVLALHISIARDIGLQTFSKQLESIEKVGKRKQWIGGREGFGYKISFSSSTF